ncbi:hypothetical protein CAP35_07215 [Chitinophagaceae bacterium IBVUCB1]|nr:hypothetical protein CAP35_07215 [Chitinophagaceae bacterium IBVUCB1]
MAEFLTTSGISHHLENIISGAKKKLILISPYLQISKTLYERLKDTNDRKVSITIIYGKNDLQANELNLLMSLNRVSLYFFENLHAKCYYNEELMIITSMNMYEFSERTNREMGILISSLNDKQVYEKAATESESILKASVLMTNHSQNNYSAPKHQSKNKEEALSYCIRCRTHLNYLDLDKPYCKDCFYTWSEYENPHYKENFCLICGKDNPSTMVKPVCRKCYR